MEIQVEYKLVVELIKKYLAPKDHFEFKKPRIYDYTLEMLLTNDISIVDDDSATQIDRDLFMSAMMQGRGKARTPHMKSRWEWPIESESPLFTSFSMDSKTPPTRECLKYDWDNLEQGHPAVIPPHFIIDWHYSGFSEKKAIGSLAPLKSIGPLLILADNYIFSMNSYERISNASRDLTKSLMLFIRGLTVSLGTLKQILVVGAPIHHQNTDETTDLMEMLVDDLKTTLQRAGFEGRLGLILSRKRQKGKENSRHDRHVFTNAGHLTISDSLRMFKSNHPHLTETLTITYRQYTNPDERDKIKFFAELLSFQIAAEQRLHLTGSIDDGLVNRALSQLIK